MTPQEIADAAINQLNARITDEVFLTIQNDRTLMHAYPAATLFTVHFSLSQSPLPNQVFSGVKPLREHIYVRNRQKSIDEYPFSAYRSQY